jgi:hypothetical protein
MEPSSAIARLPQVEEEEILALVRAEGLPLDRLRCEYTRQEGSGIHNRPWGLIRRARIMYSLMLCKWCGNLEGSEENELYCPAKLRTLRNRTKQLPEG